MHRLTAAHRVRLSAAVSYYKKEENDTSPPLNLRGLRAAIGATVDASAETAIMRIGVGTGWIIKRSIKYHRRTVYVLRVLTHKQYDTEDWIHGCRC